MLVAFGHSRSYYARHAGGLHRAFEFRAVEKILIVLLAFVLAVVARYLAAQWAEKEYGNTPRANGIGWLAFFVVLIVVGLAGLSL
jgi:hypothetical protein